MDFIDYEYLCNKKSLINYEWELELEMELIDFPSIHNTRKYVEK